MFDRFKEPKDPVEIGQCGYGDCGGEIYEGDSVYVMPDCMVHSACFVGYAKYALSAHLDYASKEVGEGL